MKMAEALKYLKDTDEMIYAVLSLKGYVLGLKLNYYKLNEKLKVKFIEGKNIEKVSMFPQLTLSDLDGADFYSCDGKYRKYYAKRVKQGRKNANI